LEDGVGVTRNRTIVERQHDLMIVKRQRFGVLHGADTGMLVGIDYECAADPERARWALLGVCRADQQNQNGARCNGAAHDPVQTFRRRPMRRIRSDCCARHSRPRRYRTAEQRYELAPSHSITSSAATSSLSGTVRPSMRAISALMTSSNLLDCTTGRSAGFVPLRMRPA